MIVRQANTNDAQWIKGQCREFLESQYPWIPWNEQHSKDMIQGIIENHLLLVADGDDGLSGFIGGLVTPHYFNPKLTILAEIFWWVTKSKRGSMAASMLLSEFTRWGRENCDILTLSLESISAVNGSSLERRGWSLKETSYVMIAN